MFEALKSLSPKQRFLGFIIVVLISAVTSLGTAYMSGSDCTEVSDKYTKSVENYNKSIENYNKLVEITDDTQQKYMKAKEDIILIQEKLNELSDILGKKSMKTVEKTKSSSVDDADVDGDGTADKEDGCPTVSGDKSNKGCPSVEEELNPVKTSSPWPTPKKIIIKEKTIVTKTVAPEGAKSMIDSLLQITKKYDKKK